MMSLAANYDSFNCDPAQYLDELGGDVKGVRNDEVTEEVEAKALIHGATSPMRGISPWRRRS